MKLETALRGLAPVFVGVAALHLALGPKADVLLGAKLPDEAVKDPALDSQSRFYGVHFSLSAVLLLLAARDVPRHSTMLRAVTWAIFAGGIARIVSIGKVGRPPVPILGLLAIELLAPPAIETWLRKAYPGR